VQSVKTVTYVQATGKAGGGQSQASPQTLHHATAAATVSPQTQISSFQPVKLTTNVAYTSSGEKITIKGLPESMQGSTVQLQLKQPLLQGLNIDPSKLTILQVSKRDHHES